MSYSTLISTGQLYRHLDVSNWVIIDCRFSLADTEAGVSDYRHGHILKAHYAHLDADLSSQITDYTGRHPLPKVDDLTNKLERWGIDNDSQVIVYDDANGAFAGRLWWLLRYLGHDKVAVLDGGFKQWRKLAYPVTTTLPSTKPGVFRAYRDDSQCLSAIEVQNGLARKDICLIDARSSERYLGEDEPVDPVAGHIPGAINRPFLLNLNQEGLFLSADELQNQFNQVIGTYSPDQVVHTCGSGVTACHNLLAMEVAGLSGSKLYPGSWSEWIRDKNRSVAVYN